MFWKKYLRGAACAAGLLSIGYGVHLAGAHMADNGNTVGVATGCILALAGAGGVLFLVLRAQSGATPPARTRIKSQAAMRVLSEECKTHEECVALAVLAQAVAAAEFSRPEGPSNA